MARFADASERTIKAGELMSGRVIEQISRAARQRAFLREVRQAVPGITVEDAEESVADAIERLSTTLTPLNIRSYLNDLSEDLAVRSVRPIVRRAAACTGIGAIPPNVACGCKHSRLGLRPNPVGTESQPTKMRASFDLRL